MRILFALFFGLLSTFVNAADEVGNWYFDGFPDVQVSYDSSVGKYKQQSSFCNRYATSDLSDKSQVRDNTAMGKKLVVLSVVNNVSETSFQCAYYEAETVNSDAPVLVYLYVYTIEQCADDEEFDKSEHSCKKKEAECPSTGNEFLGGWGTGALIYAAPEDKYYVMDGAPASVCRNKCVLNKPERAVNCFADQLPLQQGQVAHCNYNYAYSGETCASDEMYGMGEATGGYSMNPVQDGCSSSDIASTTSCEKTVNDSTTVGSSGTQVGDSNPGTGSGGSGGSSGGDSGSGGSSGGGGSSGDGSGSGTGDGDSGSVGCPGCSSGSLSEPSSKGSFGDAIADLETGIQEGKTLIQTKVKEIKETLSKNTAFTLEGGDGKLPCDSVDLPQLNMKFELCISDYSEQLSIFKYIILFAATIVAFFIVFRG